MMSMTATLGKTIHQSIYKALVGALVITPLLFNAGYAESTQQKTIAQQKTQVPGYYRMMLGDLEVTALYDGYVNLDTKLLKGASEQDIQKLLSRMFVESSKGMQTAVNAYLINTGNNLVLVDTGAAKCFGPTLGNIEDNIRAAGYEPKQVDTVLLTHLHADHACGLVKDQKAAFPNATVYVAKEEADFWLNQERMAKADPKIQGAAKLSQESVAPYVAADKFKTYAAGDTLLPNLKIVPTVGHTPGHTAYVFTSNNHSLMLWGDIVHSHAVQFPRPEIAMEFDVDSKQAIATRKQLFADAAKDQLWIGGAHLPFPGIGHVKAVGKHAYTWVPIEYHPTN